MEEKKNKENRIKKRFKFIDPIRTRVSPILAFINRHVSACLHHKYLQGSWEKKNWTVSLRFLFDNSIRIFCSWNNGTDASRLSVAEGLAYEVPNLRQNGRHKYNGGADLWWINLAHAQTPKIAFIDFSTCLARVFTKWDFVNINDRRRPIVSYFNKIGLVLN